MVATEISDKAEELLTEREREIVAQIRRETEEMRAGKLVEPLDYRAEAERLARAKNDARNEYCEFVAIAQAYGKLPHDFLPDATVDFTTGQIRRIREARQFRLQSEVKRLREEVARCHQYLEA